MKKTILILGAPILVIGFSSNTSAQITASATATARIVRPIAIAKTTDINFGNVAVSSTSGTVVLTPAGTISSTGGVTLPATAGTVSVASFNVTGEGNFTYSITLPSSDYSIKNQGPGNATMIVNAFTSSPSGTGTLTAGVQTLKVGATLNVNGSQPAGVYTNSAGFAVTVNYN